MTKVACLTFKGTPGQQGLFKLAASLLRRWLGRKDTGMSAW
jgi:hypothetical protein